MNGNSNGISTLKRMEMVLQDMSYKFTINPHQYDLKIPNRANLVYTKGGAFIDLFGEGLKEFNISGVTGFKSTTGDPNHGYNQFLAMKKLATDTMNNIQEGEPVDEDDLLKFYNHTDGEAYLTVPIKLNILRNVNEPLLFKYDLSFYVIKRVGDAKQVDEPQSIGNTETIYQKLDKRKGASTKLGATADNVMSTYKETLTDRLVEKQEGLTLTNREYAPNSISRTDRPACTYYEIDKNGTPKEQMGW